MRRTKKIMLLLVMTLMLPIPMAMAASGSSASIVLIRDIQSGTTYDRIAVSGDGNYIAVNAYGSVGEPNISLYETPESFTGSATAKWVIDTTASADIVIDNDGDKIVSLDRMDETITCYTKDSVTPEWEITSTGDMIRLWMSDNGEYIAYEESDGGRSLTMVAGADKTEYWSESLTTAVEDLAISNNGKLAIVEINDDLHFFNTTGEVWMNVSTDQRYDVKMTNDGNLVVVNSYADLKDFIVTFDSSGNLLARYADIQLSTIGVDVAADSDEIIGASYANDPNKVVILSGGSLSPVWDVTMDENCWFGRISNNGKVGVVTDYGYHVSLIDCINGKKIMEHYLGEYA
ncbi:MAG: hypothetical protein GF364_04375, partial [Candidatus Lokiarchaeota archaeon]|nr:hypothetical protein [Candidatus Lokiarchaeota archaeon]